MSKVTVSRERGMNDYLQGRDLTGVRKFNRQLILNYLREQGPASQVIIHEALNLSRATVSSLIDELKEERLVYEGKKEDARTDGRPGGRRATRIHFNANAGYVIGVDVGRTHVFSRLTNLAAETVEEGGKLEYPFEGERGWKRGLEEIAKKLDQLVEASFVGGRSVEWDQVRGIALSVPGALDPNSRMLISPPVIREIWGNVDIPDYLRRKLQKKVKDIPIYLDNDANMGALGEQHYGRGRGITNLIYIKIGTGIGAGLILNGQLYPGSWGVAGEFGHTKIEEESAPCPSCGKFGCLEALAGVRAIVDDARNGISLSSAHKKGEVGGRSASPALARHSGRVGIVDMLLAAEEGDAASCAALEHAGERIGKAIGSYLINLFNPSLILLGGGAIHVRMPEGDVRLNKLLIDCIKKNAEASSLPASWAGTEVMPCELRRSAIALGAVATVIDHDEEFGTLRTGTRSLVAATR